MSTKNSASLYCIMARNTQEAVIFRRGPSKQVLLIKWSLKSDTFEIGQWFKGRIYERRCDLSPDGSKLVYFAAKHKKPLYSWTAISKVPYFTALMLWPKGDCWGGGGHFESEYTLQLNHSTCGESELLKGFKIPKNFKTLPFGHSSGRGEDDPIWAARLKRDGWKYIEGESYKEDRKSGIWITYNPPIRYRKRSTSDKNNPYVLDMKIMGLKETGGSWYVIEHEVLNIRTQQTLNLGRTDWADWDQNGDLLYSAKGKLFRIKPQKKSEFLYDMSKSIEIADFSGLKFEEKAAPDWAKKWK